MSDLEKQINYWQTSAARNWQTAQVLYRNKRYDACLFFCHLTLEKMIKAHVTIHTNKQTPYTHDLERLAMLGGLKFTKSQISQLRIISTFNMGGRYDDEKFAFFKRCTSSYTKKYLQISQQLFLWLEKQFPPK